MTELFPPLDEYTFFTPEDVLTVHDARMNITAYGVPAVAFAEDEPEPTVEPAEALAEAEKPLVEVLPKPKHTSPAFGQGCLACEWDTLKMRISRHQEAERRGS